MVSMYYNESQNTRKILKILKKAERKSFNIKGDGFGTDNGTPDILTMDSEGKFVGLEVKSSKGHVYPTQLRRCREILESGGRYIIGYQDFSLENMDNHELPIFEYEDEDMKLPKHSLEIVFKK